MPMCKSAQTFACIKITVFMQLPAVFDAHLAICAVC